MNLRRVAIEAAHRLELFAGPDDGRGAPLLFLHGAFSGAWVWAERFLPWFAAAGRPVYAVSFRGHGGSAGHDRLAAHGLADYVEDARAALAAIGRPAIVVGHSLGGLVAQMLLGALGGGPGSAPPLLRGLALVASVPAEGLFWTNWRLAFADPLLWGETALTAGLSPRLATPELVRRTMLSDDVPPPLVRRYLARMHGESTRALAEAQTPRVWRGAAASGVPALVLSASRDRLIPPDAGLRTAWFHGAEHRLVDGIAHAMMLDAAWERAAERLESWIERRFGAAGAPAA
jgi:pimeloyl-ACP methyl ester carboxylesterase